jgi:hypothetical protein
MTKAHTDSAENRWEVKEGADGTPWIIMHPYEPSPPIFQNSFIGFEFKHKTSLSDAEEFARLLNEKLGGVLVTTFDH